MFCNGKGLVRDLYLIIRVGHMEGKRDDHSLGKTVLAVGRLDAHVLAQFILRPDPLRSPTVFVEHRELSWGLTLTRLPLIGHLGAARGIRWIHGPAP